MINYKLQRSRRKTVSIHIDAGEVIIKAPLIYPLYEIEKFINKKESWIRKNLNRQKQKPSISYKNGDYINYLGKRYLLKINELSIQEKVTLEANTIQIFSHKKINDENHNKKILNTWIMSRCENIFKSRYDNLFELFDYNNKPPLVLKRFKGRWGAYHKKGFKDSISLNINLIMYPLECLDYVIIHELSHKTHLNHSSKFYSLIADKMPTWKNAKNILDGKVD